MIKVEGGGNISKRCKSPVKDYKGCIIFYLKYVSYPISIFQERLKILEEKNKFI